MANPRRIRSQTSLGACSSATVADSMGLLEIWVTAPEGMSEVERWGAWRAAGKGSVLFWVTAGGFFCAVCSVVGLEERDVGDVAHPASRAVQVNESRACRMGLNNGMGSEDVFPFAQGAENVDIAREGLLGKCAGSGLN